MFAIILKTFCFALTVYFVSSIAASSTGPTTEPETAIKLLRNAEKTCGGHPITIYFNQHYRYLGKRHTSVIMCPLVCVAYQLGMINNVGLNKVLVKWMREYSNLKIFSETETLEERRSLERRLSPFCELLRSNKINESCAESDLTARDNRLDALLDSVTMAAEDNSTDLPVYIPSEESSEILESIRDIAYLCVHDFNTTLNDIFILFSYDLGKSKQNICAIQCILASKNFGLFDKNGLNKAWVEEFQEMATTQGFQNDFTNSVIIINELLSSLESMCLSNYNEITDLFAWEVMEKVKMEFMKLNDKYRIIE